MKSSFSSWPQHENFEELAALAAVGELSALELERLRHHLAECSRCRDAYEAFADVASNDLGVAAAARESIEDFGPADADETQAPEHLGQNSFRRSGGVSQLRVVPLQPVPQPFKMFPCLRLVCIGWAEVFDGFAGCSGHS